MILKKKGELRAEKKQENVTHNGVIASYVHANNKVGCFSSNCAARQIL